MTGGLRERITDALRQRVTTGLQRGGLRPGDRLPTTRELAADLDADARVVAAAYRSLAEEGLVEIRERSGVFVAARAGSAGASGAPPIPWLAEVIAQGIARGTPAPSLGASITRATTAKPISAAVLAATVDQAMGLARELRDDFGIAAQGVLVETLRPGERLPRAVERAHLLVATELTAPLAARLAGRLGKHHLVVDVRPDLLSPEWRLLLARAAYVVLADPRFGALVHALLEGADGARNVRILVAGRDSLSEIPPDAPTYVTEAARDRLGGNRLPGRVLPPTRTLSAESVLAIARVLVERNLGAG